MVNPNWFVWTPKPVSPVSTRGSQSAVGRPSNVGPQPVLPGK